MFLPGRDVDKEKAVRQAAFAKIEVWAKDLIQDNAVREACQISIQEVQCGDPNCAPIDTMLTMAFDSGGTGMMGLPMEAHEVTPDLLQEMFPTADVLQKWFRGEDAAWPPEPEPQELRFSLGTAVLCRVGPSEWVQGTVQQLWYRENAWPEGAFAPYKILLKDGRDIFAPQDMDQIIRLDPDAAPNRVSE